jgi:hypothetical protein
LYTTLFAVLAKALRENPEKYHDPKVFEKLFHKGIMPPEGSKRRYLSYLYDSNIAMLKDAKELGCSNQMCPTRDHLIDLAEKVKSWDELSSFDQELANEWRLHNKLCGG